MRINLIPERIKHLHIRHIPKRQLIFILSAVVGLAAGLGAVIIKNAVHFLKELITTGQAGNFQHYLYFVFPIAGLLIAMVFIKYINRRPVQHGIPSVLYAISRNNGIIHSHNLYSSIISSALTVGFGGSVGLEGPTVATGGAMGSLAGRLAKLTYKETILLVGCASAGAMSAIFKAPIAGIVFALEVIMLDLTVFSMIPLLIASATAALTSYFFLGQNFLYSFQIQEPFRLGDFYLYIILGVFTGLISVYFIRVFIFISEWFDKIHSWVKRLLIGGGILGILIFVFPSLYGEGYEVINRALHGNYSFLFSGTFYDTLGGNTIFILFFLFLMIIFKSIATTLTFAAGGVGGVFAPSLFTGVNAGLFLGVLLNHLGIHVSLSNFALVGMAGLISGVIHAPLTAIFLIAEITGGNELFMPLMIASTISYATTHIFVKNSVYAVQLARRGELMTHHKDKNILLMMNVGDLIETNFSVIHPENKLGDLVKTIKDSHRNIFPVVDSDGTFKGIVKMDDIRHIMFDASLYDKTLVKDLMFMPDNIIEYNERMESVARKFQESGRYNIAVLKDGKYMGFVSRARVFSSYREMLKLFSDE
ncbi:MAG TPA: chloride channel protein [Bacteroidales bacterium]|nr:chloride channel protein [Bacteroidales bacterium]